MEVSMGSRARSPWVVSMLRTVGRVLLRPRSLGLAALLLVAVPRSAWATHFAFGTMSWERDTTFVSSTLNRYVISYELAFREDYPWPEGPPSVGDVIHDEIPI